jgi:hypothetical protein
VLVVPDNHCLLSVKGSGSGVNSVSRVLCLALLVDKRGLSVQYT